MDDKSNPCVRKANGQRETDQTKRNLCSLAHAPAAHAVCGVDKHLCSSQHSCGLVEREEARKMLRRQSWLIEESWMRTVHRRLHLQIPAEVNQYKFISHPIGGPILLC